MAKQLVSASVGLAETFEAVAKESGVQNAVKWVAGPVSAGWKAMEARGGTPDEAVGIIRRFAAGEITDTECAMEIRCAMTGESAEAAAGASQDLERIVSEYLDQNPEIVSDYAKNEKAANKAIGFVMRNSGGKHSSAEVVEAVKRLIESRMRSHGVR